MHYSVAFFKNSITIVLLIMSVNLENLRKKLFNFVSCFRFRLIAQNVFLPLANIIYSTFKKSANILKMEKSIDGGGRQWQSCEF